ncbi:MAG: hypothetical protein ABEJ95_00110 [Candidatus Nanohalobium sp.]
MSKTDGDQGVSEDSSEKLDELGKLLGGWIEAKWLKLVNLNNLRSKLL